MEKELSEPVWIKLWSDDFDKVKNLADQEDRKKSHMIRILVHEALKARKI